MRTETQMISFTEMEREAFICKGVWISNSITETVDTLWGDRENMSQEEAEGHVMRTVNGAPGYKEIAAFRVDGEWRIPEYAVLKEVLGGHYGSDEWINEEIPRRTLLRWKAKAKALLAA
jgi:hypothetical protein